MSEAPRGRVYPRQLRRLQVRFWRPQEDRPRQGFTKNLSLTGAYVSTPDPAGRGERLRLELSDDGRIALLYAVVVHSHRVPPELRRFADSAMGLRFLGLDEVVGPFLGDQALRPHPNGDPGNRRATGASEASRGTSGSTGVGEATAGPEPRPGAEVASSSTGTAGHPPPASDSVPGESADPAAAKYVLAFRSLEEFLATYRRDLVNGGLFLTTDRPARLDERVAVELRLPGASGAIRVNARVVQVVEPRPLASGQVVGGMGLELLDPETVARQLAPHVPES